MLLFLSNYLRVARESMGDGTDRGMFVSQTSVSDLKMKQFRAQTSQIPERTPVALRRLLPHSIFQPYIPWYPSCLFSAPEYLTKGGGIFFWSLGPSYYVSD